MVKNLLLKISQLLHPKTVKIGEILLNKKLISEEQLQEALSSQHENGKKLGDVLISKGIITNQQLEQALTTQYWQNITATFLISLGTLASTVPQVAVAQFSSTPRHSQTEFRNRFSGDRELSRANMSYLSNKKNLDNFGDSTKINSGNRTSTEHTSLAANPTPTESNPLNGFMYPFNHYRPMSQAYNGTTHRGRMSYAVDLAAGIGTPVFAMRSGTVVGIEDRFPDTGGGRENISKFNYVWIEHDGGYRSAYLHLKQGFTGSINIKVGDRVRGGQLIGFSGNSGWSSGPHLHVEVHRYENSGNFGQTVPFHLTMWSPSGVARN
jgi:murein DD-endopeptidase MepM/ murein hydrolase activator NlpD